MKRLFEFLFCKWKSEIIKRGRERWCKEIMGTPIAGSEFYRDFVDYKLVNKFDGSEKIKRVYIN